MAQKESEWQYQMRYGADRPQSTTALNQNLLSVTEDNGRLGSDVKRVVLASNPDSASMTGCQDH